jgi:NADH-quinone oxidoreductase chain G
MITLKINNQIVKVPQGSSILEACKELGLDIPRFCYHEKLSVAGNCRMCLVEIEKSPKPVAACAMPVVPNMVVFTDSPLVKKARENVLEIMLLNHPLDCPICDQGGECDLQDQTRIYGGDYSRFHLIKRSVEDKYCGPLIKTIMTRCIHCTRCVRFATEIAGIDTLGTLKRGEETEIGSYISRVLNTEISGNVIDLCPVGALTSKPYAFTSRPWELRKSSSIDALDCVGSKISVEFKETEIVRILPRFSKDINEEWISDKIRFSYDGVSRSRMKNVYKKEEGSFKMLDWEYLLNILLNSFTKKNILIPIQSVLDNMTLIFLKLLSTSKNLRIRLMENVTTDSTTNATIENITLSDSCFLFGTNLRLETPILQIRIRTQFLKGDYLVSSVGVPFNNTVNTNYISLGIHSIMNILSGKSVFQQVVSSSKIPFFFIGMSVMNRINSKIISKLLLDLNKNVFILFVNTTPNLKTLEFLNFKKMSKNDLDWSDTVLSLNLEENYILRKLIYKTNKVLYMASTHGSKLVQKANLIIPVSTFFESAYSYINTEGREQKTNKILPGSFSDMISLSILTKSFLSLVNLEKYEKEAKNNYLELKMVYKNPNAFLMNRFKIFYLTNLNKDLITLYPLKSNIEDFYLSNKLTRASVIMGQCSQTYQNTATNFIN